MYCIALWDVATKFTEDICFYCKISGYWKKNSFILRLFMKHYKACIQNCSKLSMQGVFGEYILIINEAKSLKLW